jgi:hypothetical protein
LLHKCNGLRTISQFLNHDSIIFDFMQLQILSIKRRIAMAVASVAVSYIIKRYILKTGKKEFPSISHRHQNAIRSLCLRYSTDYIANASHWFMPKHKLLQLQKIIEERTGSLTEEVEIATNVKLNPLYIVDRKDEIEFLQWIIRVIQPILNRDIGDHQQVGVTKKRLEMMQTIEFENVLQERVQELKLKLKDCDNLRESDILINEIDTLESILGRLSDLKYGEKVRAIEVAEASNNYQQANRLRKQIIKFQDIESEISAQCSSTKFRLTS